LYIHTIALCSFEQNSNAGKDDPIIDAALFEALIPRASTGDVALSNSDYTAVPLIATTGAAMDGHIRWDSFGFDADDLNAFDMNMQIER
jgi:hypothetical protein